MFNANNKQGKDNHTSGTASPIIEAKTVNYSVNLKDESKSSDYEVVYYLLGCGMGNYLCLMPAKTSESYDEFIKYLGIIGLTNASIVEQFINVGEKIKSDNYEKSDIQNFLELAKEVRELIKLKSTKNSRLYFNLGYNLFNLFTMIYLNENEPITIKDDYVKITCESMLDLIQKIDVNDRIKDLIITFFSKEQYDKEDTEIINNLSNQLCYSFSNR